MLQRFAFLFLTVATIASAQTGAMMSINYAPNPYFDVALGRVEPIRFIGTPGKDSIEVKWKDGPTYHYPLANLRDLTFSNLQPTDSIRFELESGLVRTMAVSSLSSLSFIDADIPAGVSIEDSAPPSAFSLEQNYPNPFNPSTTIQYSLVRHARVSLTVSTLLGQIVATLVDEEQSAGLHRVTWLASSMPSGIYFYRLHAGSLSAAKVMFLLK